MWGNLCPLAWAVPTRRVCGEGRLITAPADDVAVAGTCGGGGACSPGTRWGWYPGVGAQHEA